MGTNQPDLTDDHMTLKEEIAAAPDDASVQRINPAVRDPDNIQLESFSA